MLLGNPHNESFYHIIQQWNCSLTKYKGLKEKKTQKQKKNKPETMHSFLHYTTLVPILC